MLLPPRAAACRSPLSPPFSFCLLSFREFQLYGHGREDREGLGEKEEKKDRKNKLETDERLDCQVQEATTCRACRKANDFNSVPLSWHAGSEFLPSLPSLSLSLSLSTSRILRCSSLFPPFFPLRPSPPRGTARPSSLSYPSAKLNLLRIGLTEEHRRIFKFSTRGASDVSSIPPSRPVTRILSSRGKRAAMKFLCLRERLVRTYVRLRVGWRNVGGKG